MISQLTLTDLYEVQKLSYRQIAHLEKCSVSTVRYWMKKYGIQPRPRSKKSTHRINERRIFQNRYGRVMVFLKGIKKSRAVLMAMSVIEGEWLSNLCVHHLNGDPSDDRFENLAIANHYIHQVSSLPNSKCIHLEEAMIPLARFAGLEEHLELTDYGYRLNTNIELIPEWEITRIANATLTICGKCGSCFNKDPD